MPSYKNIVVLTGAGISAESGISTFRDQNGLWEKYRSTWKKPARILMKPSMGQLRRWCRNFFSSYWPDMARVSAIAKSTPLEGVKQILGHYLSSLQVTASQSFLVDSNALNYTAFSWLLLLI